MSQDFTAVHYYISSTAKRSEWVSMFSKWILFATLPTPGQALVTHVFHCIVHGIFNRRPNFSAQVLWLLQSNEMQNLSVVSGRTRIKLRKNGEVYSLVPPNSKAHNVIVGGVWVDCYGTFKLSNVTTGTQCSLYFTPCGWFGSGRYEVNALTIVWQLTIIAEHVLTRRQ